MSCDVHDAIINLVRDRSELGAGGAWGWSEWRRAQMFAASLAWNSGTFGICCLEIAVEDMQHPNRPQNLKDVDRSISINR